LHFSLDQNADWFILAIMDRLYDRLLRDHLLQHRQMAFVTGPRQVGKTTTCRALGDRYFSWDVPEHSRLVTGGPGSVAEAAGLHVLSESTPVLVFDELHKYPRWKSFLKGFFDLHEQDCRILVTGSSRLDVFRRRGDSLMGRYFLYRMHPLSVAELLGTELPDKGLWRQPRELDHDKWETLLRWGGFPEPWEKSSETFSRRWQNLRRTQLIREDARDLTRIQELPLLEVMARLLEERSGQQLIYANLARDVSVSPHTARSWVDTLGALHFGFCLKPWFRNIASSLRKEPKWFLRDWSVIADEGQRFETMVACHLLKAVEGWTDLGLGTFELRYLRDKMQREVDFLVIRDGQPWFLVEAKLSDKTPSPALHHFQNQTKAPHAFQIVKNLPYVEANPFEKSTPVAVSAKTLLSQFL